MRADSHSNAPSRGAVFVAAGFCWIALLTPIPLRAADEPVRHTLHIPPASSPITLDGDLSDPAWQRAPTLYLARIGNLAPLYPATAKLLHDDAALYLAIEAADQDLQSNHTQRDSYVWQDGDCFELFLGPPAGKYSKLEFQINPRGAVMDIAYNREGGTFDDYVKWNWPGAAWKIVLDGTLNDTTIDRGWRVELRLPWCDEVPRPQPDQPWTGLVSFLNRVKLADGREPRESSYWPMLTYENFHAVSEWATFVFTAADPADMPVEGFAVAEHGSNGNTNVYLPDYRGMVSAWGLANSDAGRVVRWCTQPVPADRTGNVTFVFAGISYAGKGYKPDQFILHVNGKEAIRFDPHRIESHTWTHESVTLTYHYRRGSAHSSGVFALTLPPAMIKPGEPVVLSITPGDNPAPRAGFNVMAWTDAARYEYYMAGVGRN